MRASGVGRSTPLVIRELLRAEAFPHAVGNLTLRETHISWVVLAGPFAYKIKKPVKFEFIDASTIEQRRHYCEEELRLNKRLAADLYIDVVAITRRGDRAVVGGRGPAVEYAVRMRQFAATDELPTLLAHNDVSVEDLVALGELLAQFHLRAAVAPWTGAAEKTGTLYDSVFANLEQLLAHSGPPNPCGEIDRLIKWTHDSARVLKQSLQARERAGFVRECHGDLHAANIVRWRGRLVPFDCIEFDPQLRWIDVINDISFLVMDLISRQRADLAAALLSRYLELTGDYDGVRVLPFHAAYRALVRAKIDAIAAEQNPSRGHEFRDRLQQRIHAAIAWTIPQQAVLILMHGVSGSGKTWLSQRLIPELHAIRVRSDLERKRLAGMNVNEHAPAGVRQGIYSPQSSRRTYDRLAECAENCLRAGFNTIVDAAFQDPADRAMLRALAEQSGARCIIVSCRADRATLATRVTQRAAARGDASDATLSILDAQLRDIQPFTASELPCVIPIDTNEPNAVQRVLDAIGARTTT
jgi:aminoglycoside phosphotransferase family enzyme/predicted kinase